MSDTNAQIMQIEAAIAAQEALRPTLSDAVVDVTLIALRNQLETLRKQQSPPPETSDQLLTRIQSYLPKELADKMRSVGRIEGERRQVTVLFADISGFTALSEQLDPEEMVILINEVLKDMAESVYQYEGYVDKFLGDAVMAVFGAPIAHEDDAERALRASLEMRERLERFNRRRADRLPKPLSLHIGVNTGTVVAGNVGSDLRMSYTVMGDTVNTASRLEGASESGQILVSRDTYRLAREAFTFLAMEPIRVKGKREPLTVYELQRAKLMPGKTRGLHDLTYSFVGREQEMSQLKEVFVGLKTGQGRIVVVSGEAGIGKSRLLAELKRDIVGHEQVYWLEGRCLAYTSSVSYGPFLDLIRHHAGIRDEHSENAARWRFDISANQFFPEDAEAKALIANMMALRLSAEETALLKRIPGEQFRQKIFDLMLSFFTKLAKEHPTLLIIEDIHWADTTSLELIEHLLSLTEKLPLAIVSVSRRETSGASESWAKLMNKIGEHHANRMTHITLKPLSEMSSLEMVSRLLSLDNLPSALKALIVGKAEGNPFFVEELIRTLIERGALAQSFEDKWEITPIIESVTVPDTLQGLLMSRLDRLPPETKWLAQQASVIGRIFLYRILHHIAEKQSCVDDDLSCMERNELIREKARDPELQYMFRHALTQETAYSSLLAQRRKELHCKTAQAMEELFADRIAEFTVVIGEHFLKGEAWDKAYQYLMQAGDIASRLYAFAEARLHYARGLEILSHLPDTEDHRRNKVDTTINLVRLAFSSDSPELNMERLSEAEQVAQKLSGIDGNLRGDPLRLTRIRYWMGRIHTTNNAIPEAIRYFRMVLAVAQELGDPEMIAIPSVSIGIALYFQGHFGKSRMLFRQAIAAVEQLNNLTEWLRTIFYHAIAMATTGNYNDGIAECQRGVACAYEVNSMYGICTGNIMLLKIYADGGDMSGVIESAYKGLEACSKSGDLVVSFLGYVAKSYAEVCNGQFEAVSVSVYKAQILLQQLGGKVVAADILASINTELALGMGNVEKAIELAEQTIAIAKKIGGIWSEGMARQTLGKAFAKLNPPKWDEAEAQMAESLRLFEFGEARLYAARNHEAWGIICRDRGNISAAREHFEKAATQWKTSEIPWELEKVNKLIAELPSV